MSRKRRLLFDGRILEFACKGASAYIRRFVDIRIAVLFIPGVVSCGHPDYSIALPKGYELTRCREGAYVVSDARSLITIGYTIQRYAVEGNLVTGYVTHSGLRPVAEAFLGKEGYFVLDTATGDLQDGLSEDKWREALASRGISPPPPLKEPSREDAMAPE